MTIPIGSNRIATYARVSSDDQAERGTIETQRAEIARWLDRHPDFDLVATFEDDGVSGTIPLKLRPAGARLMADAMAGRFDCLLVYKVDRLGRDAVDLMGVRRRLATLEVRLLSVHEGEPDTLSYNVQAVVADYQRETFLRTTKDGIRRAAREGRSVGGIIAFGYRVAGDKGNRRLEPDTAPLWADRSAVDIVRQMYQRVGLEGWSCTRVAAELNALGVPTHYSRDGRLVKHGERRESTQALWRTGRVRNMLASPLYRGEASFGKRSEKKHPEVITAQIEPLVSVELWEAAQATLARNRLCAKNTDRVYLLRGVLRCGLCGLTYLGSHGRGEVAWYRCGGQLKERGPIPGRCPSRSIRADSLEPMVWQDIECFLRHPGDALAELDGSVERDVEAAGRAAELITLQRARDVLDAQQARAITMVVKGLVGEDMLRPELDRIASERSEIDRRLASFEAAIDVRPAISVDQLAELLDRLDAGVTPEQRQEIVRLLVSDIVIRTEINEDGTKDASATIGYRFPRAVVSTRTARDSWPRRAGDALDIGWSHEREPVRRSHPRAADEGRRAHRGRTPPARP